MINYTRAILWLFFHFIPFYPVVSQQLDEIINTSRLGKGDAVGEHPRGLIRKQEVPAIRARATTGQFAVVMEKIRHEEESLSKTISESEEIVAQHIAELVANQSYLFLLTGENSWADKAYANLTTLFKDTLIVNNPVSRGLTRAAVLQKMAYSYDFCYEGWTQDQRNLVNQQIYKLIYATSANMGYDANYSLVSNWMGVRWGSVLFASLVWDSPGNNPRSLVQPLLWDAQKRLSDHLAQNIYPEGWSAESIGYHIYNWSFVGPALIAFQNQQGTTSPAAIHALAPQLEYAVKGIASAALSIRTGADKVGMKPDLSDDGLNLGEGLFSMALRLYPPAQIPSIKWMHDYLSEATLYSLLYYPDTVSAENPALADWLNHADSGQGVVTFRNRFADADDIVAVFNTSENRVAGHKGPDVNTFRIIGLGVPWIIGGGRTNLVAGQSNLFPGVVSSSDKGDMKAEGELLYHTFYGDGSGEAVGRGSSTGVLNHRRKWMADFSEDTGAAAVFVVADSSENGKIWRINTPEFVKIASGSGTFTLTAPNGASLTAHFFSEDGPVTVSSGLLRYGGETVRLNSGIQYKGAQYAFSNYIDLHMEKNLLVVMTLQPKNEKHPVPQWDKKSGNITITNKTYHGFTRVY
nr:hypothetical protein [Cytophagales bacterium]